MEPEGEAMLAAHPPLSPRLLHPLLQRRAMMLPPSPTTFFGFKTPIPTNPIPLPKPKRAQVLLAAGLPLPTGECVQRSRKCTQQSEAARVCYTNWVMQLSHEPEINQIMQDD